MAKRENRMALINRCMRRFMAHNKAIGKTPVTMPGPLRDNGIAQSECVHVFMRGGSSRLGSR